MAAGGGKVGESNNCPDWVSDRLFLGPASSPVDPPAPTPPVMAVVVAITMRAFWGSATVARLA